MKGTLKVDEELRTDLLRLAEPKLRDLRCPTHGEAAQVNPTLSGLTTEWNVTACCDEFLGRARAALNEVRAFPPNTVVKGESVIYRTPGPTRRRRT
jgi:hypothetical protein